MLPLTASSKVVRCYVRSMFDVVRLKKEIMSGGGGWRVEGWREQVLTFCDNALVTATEV